MEFHEMLNVATGGGKQSSVGRLTWMCIAAALITSSKLPRAISSELIECSDMEAGLYPTLRQVINSSGIDIEPCTVFEGSDEVCPSYFYPYHYFKVTCSYEAAYYLYQVQNVTLTQCLSGCNLSTNDPGVDSDTGQVFNKVEMYMETGCYKLVVNAMENISEPYMYCFWLRNRFETDKITEDTAIEKVNHTFNMTLGAISVTGTQRRFKPVIIYLEGMSLPTPPACIENERTGLFECACHHNTSCIRESFDTFTCIFYNISRGNYTVHYGVDLNQDCIKHEDCTFKSLEVTSVRHEPPSKQFAESSLSPKSMLAIALASIILTSSLVVIIVCYFRHRIQSTKVSVSPSSSEDLEIPSCVLRKGILLVYTLDCNKFLSTMADLSKILSNAFQCTVYDILDEKWRKENGEENAFLWLVSKLNYVDKVVMVETDMSHIIKFTTAKFRRSSVNDSVIRFYQTIDRFLLDPQIGPKIFTVRLDQFSPEVGEISSLISMFPPNNNVNVGPTLSFSLRNTPYVLPQSMRHLLRELSEGNADEIHIHSVEGETSQKAKHYQLQNSLKKSVQDLALFKTSNRTYVMDFFDT